MIKILDSNLKRLAILKQIISSNRFEEINGENTLAFNTILSEKVSSFVVEDNIVEIENDYFDIVFYQKQQNEDGTLNMQVQAEHISYRLNNPEYNMEMFTAIGTPHQVLSQILSGTGFSVGSIEFTDTVAYSAQEAKSRRQILMEFAVSIGGEVDFNKFEISIVQHRGNSSSKLLTKGKNIKVVSKTYNKRQVDKDGNPLVSYMCTPIQTESTPLNLGDEVLLIQKDLSIKEKLRIVRIGYNPYDNIEASVELANFISGLEDQIYKIETGTVSKDKLYYGARIGPEFGFESVRYDKKARACFNADTFVMQAGDGNGSYTDKLYFNPTNGEFIFDGTIYAQNGIFSGLVQAATIKGCVVEGTEIIGGTIAIGDNFSVDNLGNMIANNANFTGNITGSDITGSTITGSVINVYTDVNIGEDLYLNGPGIGSIYYKSGDGIGAGLNLFPTFCMLGAEDYALVQTCYFRQNAITAMSDLYAYNIYSNNNLVATESWVSNNFATLNHSHGYATQSDIDAAIAAHVALYH